MIIYKTVPTDRREYVGISFDKFICDKCKEEVTNQLELQEAQTIRFTGGYASVFGDGNRVSCDLCQGCLKELIGDFCIYNTER